MRSRALAVAALLLSAVASTALPTALVAQSPSQVRDELLLQFDASMSKFIALARAMPADRFTWAPGEGVMEVGHVYMHVARYNYLYPSDNMGVAAPAGVDLAGMEQVRDRDAAIRALEQSAAYVRTAVRSMTDAELTSTTRLYGREVPRTAVLVQLVAHMNEHLGQSIAYARMNGIVPPWSR
jgi:uncharacterized damage-inducible protein DinB